MSGGASEYVMGHYDDTIDVFNDSSGFTTLPISKYYDKYGTSDVLTACNGGICYGHALLEVYDWYDDYQTFVSEDGAWLLRGGYYQHGSGAGIFYSYGDYGDSWTAISWRSVLVANNKLLL